MTMAGEAVPGAAGEQRSIPSLDDFLKSVEGRAFKMAWMATGSREDALDIVQDVMMAFVRRYRRKPSEQWRPLFFRALDNRIKDCFRRRKARFRWFGHQATASDNQPEDPVERLPDHNRPGPELAGHGEDVAEALESALAQLPDRQRQAFLFRTWEGLSVAETARVMGCSQGSVKTHLSRAMQSLRQQLESFRI